jgi:hypothetical protein
MRPQEVVTWGRCIAPLKTMRSFCAYLALLACLAGCTPDYPNDFSHYGKPIAVSEPTLQQLWQDFAHECDWRVFGPGRVREKSANGTYSWRQIHVPALKLQYAEMKASPVWNTLKDKVKEDHKSGVNFLIECWSGYKQSNLQKAWIANSARLWNDERDLIPLIILELLSQDKNYEVRDPVGGVLEDYCKPGRMSEIVATHSTGCSSRANSK